MPFVYHILIVSLIFGLLASGFRFFIKLKWNCDFSYLAIVIFASYVCAILNTKLWFWFLWSLWISIISAIPFAFLIFLLSKRLNAFYFSIWTITLYILAYQLAYNLEITNWSFWILWITKNIVWNIEANSLVSFLIMMFLVSIIVFTLLFLFKKSVLYKSLVAWGEKEIPLKSLGISISMCKILIILISVVLASIAWACYTFYYWYIDPSSFWFPMLILVLTIVFLSYKYNEFWVVLSAILIMFFYEWLRFVKFVEPWKIWYIREILFSLAMIIVAFITFKKINFWREQ